MGRVISMWAVCAAGALAGVSYGQAFNIDCAGNLGTPPTSSYGAGAGQPGFWNPARLNTDLRNLNGDLTAAHLAVGGAGSNTHAIPGATGEDLALMQTTYDMAPSASVSIANLIPGLYDLYAYSWIPLNRTVGFGVYNGVSTTGGSVAYGSVWPGGQVEGVTFARIAVEVLPGQGYLIVNIGSGHDYDVLAGIQLILVPAPGASLVVLGAALVCVRRRR